MKKADCDGTRLITDVVGIEKWGICDVGTPTILETDKDVGKMWFLILGHLSQLCPGCILHLLVYLLLLLYAE